MAEDGRLPGPLAVVSKRHSSPLGATVFVTGVRAVALLADVFWKGLFALPEKLPTMTPCFPGARPSAASPW